MFDCKGCKALKAENEYLKTLIDRLLDKSVGPVIDVRAQDELAQPTPPSIEKDDEGNIIAEHFSYGQV